MMEGNQMRERYEYSDSPAKQLSDEESDNKPVRSDVHDYEEKSVAATSVSRGNGSGDFGDHTGGNRREEENGAKVAFDQLRVTVRALWKTGLEIFIHQLLYRREIYPRDTFSSARFVGAECKINRNPGVRVYIAEALKVVMAAIFGDENGNRSEYVRSVCLSKELLIEIYDQAKGITYEQFSLSFSFPSTDGDEDYDTISTALGSFRSFPRLAEGGNPDLANLIIGVVEKDLRDLVCSTGKLDGFKSCDWGDSVSFKILLLVDPSKRSSNEMAPLVRQFDGSKWVGSKRKYSSCLAEKRIIHDLSNSSCRFQYHMV